jgi:serine/threonine protein kinase
VNTTRPDSDNSGFYRAAGSDVSRVEPITPTPPATTCAGDELSLGALLEDRAPDTVIGEVVTQVAETVPEVPGYTIERELGRGGMGVVYLARQNHLNRQVALKMILAGEHASPRDRARFLAEAEAIAKIHHPGVVQVYDFGVHDGHAYFALEYIPGGTLHDRLRGMPLPARDAAAVVAEIADGVQAAHDQGIVHRDLKPANVLLSRAGETQMPGEGRPSNAPTPSTSIWGPKIADFGLAKAIEADSGLTSAGAVLGTPSYMAPEQASGRGEVGPATDVYALGAILYQCLTGRPPFQGVAVQDTLWLVLTQDPVPPRSLQPGLPRDLDTICLKALGREPTRRYASAAEMAADLRRFLGGEPILARPAGWGEKSWRWARRNPTVAALAGSLLTVIIASLAILAGLLARSEQLRQRAELNEQKAQQMQGVAEQHAQAAHQQRERMESSFRLARAALDRALALKDDPAFAKGPLERVRLELVTAEKEFFEKFLDVLGDQPGFQMERAEALTNLGFFQSKFAAKTDLAECEQLLQRAVAIWRELLARDPANIKYRRGLCAALGFLAAVDIMRARLDSALANYRAAVQTIDPLLAPDTVTDPIRIDAARAWSNLANCLRQLRIDDDGEAEFLRAAAILAPLRQNQPDDLSAFAPHVAILQNRAAIRLTRNQFDEAIRLLAPLLEEQERIAQRFPEVPIVRIDLMSTLQTCGRAALHARRPREASNYLERASSGWQRLADEHPAMHEVRFNLALTREALGNTLLFLGDRDGSFAQMKQAEDLFSTLCQQHPEVTAYRVHWAGVLVSQSQAYMLINECKKVTDLLSRVKAVLDPVLAAEPQHANANLFLKMAGYANALAHCRLGNPAKSVACIDEVVKHLADPDPTLFAPLRGRAQLMLGERHAALAALKPLETGQTHQVEPYAEGVLIAVTIARGFAGDDRLSEAERSAESERAMALAVRILANGKRLRLFPSRAFCRMMLGPDVTSHLENRPDFHSLFPEPPMK